MKYNELITTLDKFWGNRYRIQKNSDILKLIESIAPIELTQKKLFRIQRKYYPTKENLYWKTLLIVGISQIEQLKHAITWTASVKDILLNPEPSDIYLFLCWDEGLQPSLDECLRIEATEEFCRKYVVHPDESYESFIERTFILTVDNSSQNISGSDPLISAFSDVEKEYSWFNHEKQQKWRDAFSSGKTGTDLIEELFDIKNEI